MGLPDVSQEHSGKKVTSLKSSGEMRWHPGYPSESTKQGSWFLGELCL